MKDINIVLDMNYDDTMFLVIAIIFSFLFIFYFIIYIYIFEVFTNKPSDHSFYIYYSNNVYPFIQCINS